MKIGRLTAALALFFALASSAAFAQKPALDAAFRNSTIDALLALLKERYAYPEVAAEMETAIRARQKRGEYDALTEGADLAKKLTGDLRAVFDDKHLVMSYSEQAIPVNSARAGAPSAEEIAAARKRQTRENFGLQKVEILKGNVGLIKLNYFAPLDWAADSYAAALNTVAEADALIFDLTDNGGSMDIDAIPFVASYLFERPVLLSDHAVRGSNEVRQLWTYARVPGKRFLDRPVFVLTSSRTASGAEAFVSQLKRLKRAVIVGEVTRGATMPGGSARVNEHFTVWISTGRSSESSSKRENKGVEPDVVAPREKALAAAYVEALKGLAQTTTDEAWKSELQKLAAETEKTLR